LIAASQVEIDSETLTLGQLRSHEWRQDSRLHLPQGNLHQGPLPHLAHSLCSHGEGSHRLEMGSSCCPVFGSPPPSVLFSRFTTCWVPSPRSHTARLVCATEVTRGGASPCSSAELRRSLVPLSHQNKAGTMGRMSCIQLSDEQRKQYTRCRITHHVYGLLSSSPNLPSSCQCLVALRQVAPRHEQHQASSGYDVRTPLGHDDSKPYTISNRSTSQPLSWTNARKVYRQPRKHGPIGIRGSASTKSRPNTQRVPTPGKLGNSKLSFPLEARCHAAWSPLPPAEPHDGRPGCDMERARHG
jgi:hypothetical protein